MRKGPDPFLVRYTDDYDPDKPHSGSPIARDENGCMIGVIETEHKITPVNSYGCFTYADDETFVEKPEKF